MTHLPKQIHSLILKKAKSIHTRYLHGPGRVDKGSGTDFSSSRATDGRQVDCTKSCMALVSIFRQINGLGVRSQLKPSENRCLRMPWAPRIPSQLIELSEDERIIQLANRCLLSEVLGKYQLWSQNGSLVSQLPHMYMHAYVGL